MYRIAKSDLVTTVWCMNKTERQMLSVREAANYILSKTEPRYATVKDAATYLQVTERTIRQMIADGRLTGYKLGNRVLRIDLNELDAAMTRVGGGAA